MAVVGCIWFIYIFLYQTQVQSYQKFVVALVLTVNGQRDGTVVNYIIGLSVVVDSDLRNFLLALVDLSYHRLTVPSITAGRGLVHGLKPSLSVVGWMNF